MFSTLQVYFFLIKVCYLLTSTHQNKTKIIMYILCERPASRNRRGVWVGRVGGPGKIKNPPEKGWGRPNFKTTITMPAQIEHLTTQHNLYMIHQTSLRLLYCCRDFALFDADPKRRYKHTTDFQVMNFQN